MDEQSRSVNQHPNVLELVGQRAALKQAGVAPAIPGTRNSTVRSVARGVGRGRRS
jgi:hypothetical protein